MKGAVAFPLLFVFFPSEVRKEGKATSTECVERASNDMSQYSPTVEKQVNDVHFRAYNQWTSESSLVDMKLTVTFSANTTPDAAQAVAASSLGELRKDLQWPTSSKYRQQGSIKWETEDRVTRGTTCFMLP